MAPNKLLFYIPVINTPSFVFFCFQNPGASEHLPMHPLLKSLQPASHCEIKCPHLCTIDQCLTHIAFCYPYPCLFALVDVVILIYASVFLCVVFFFVWFPEQYYCIILMWHSYKRLHEPLKGVKFTLKYVHSNLSCLAWVQIWTHD